MLMVELGMPFMLQLFVALASGLAVAAVVEDGRPRLMWATLACVFSVALLAVVIRL
jgi:hypothetical protein